MHRAHITSVFVDSGFRGQGIGKKLMEQALEKAASIDHIEQVELTVVTEKIPAISLYQSLGFHIYASESRSLKYKGRYYNEHYMMKIIQ